MIINIQQIIAVTEAPGIVNLYTPAGLIILEGIQEDIDTAMHDIRTGDFSGGLVCPPRLTVSQMPRG